MTSGGQEKTSTNQRQAFRLKSRPAEYKVANSEPCRQSLTNRLYLYHSWAVGAGSWPSVASFLVHDCGSNQAPEFSLKLFVRGFVYSPRLEQQILL